MFLTLGFFRDHGFGCFGFSLTFWLWFFRFLAVEPFTGDF